MLNQCDAQLLHHPYRKTSENRENLISGAE